jgi:hypothetical protein
MYRHTQIGWVMLAVMAALSVFFVATNQRLLAQGMAWLPLGILVAVLLLFGSLTVTVEERELRARFGIGLVGTTVPLDQVVSCAVVENSWLWGWGIRLYPGGRLYNVSGLRAVELVLQDGRRVRIGSDEPEALAVALRPFVGARPGPPAIEPRGAVPWRILGWVLGLAAIGFLVWLVFMSHAEMQPPRANLTATALEVKSFLYGAELPLREITEVSLETRLPGLRRTNGFAASGVLRGHFSAAELGSGMVFADQGNPPFLVVRTATTFLIVGFPDPGQTQALHDALVRARGR